MRSIIDAADNITGHNDIALSKIYRQKADNLNYLFKCLEEDIQKLSFQ